jgi:hypothetical protein
MRRGEGRHQRRRAAALAGLLLLAPLAARAEAPRVMPTRDVDVTYLVAGDLHQRLRWNVAAQRLRIDPPLPEMYMVVDLAAGRMSMVQTTHHLVAELPTGHAGLPLPQGSGEWERAGTDRVAGLACTLWRTQDVSARPVTLCLTEDGVMLRATGAQGMLVEAEQVVYGPADPAAFVVPPDYQRLQPEAAPP